MVRIRLSRMGKKHSPFYRINAIEKAVKRDGKVLENLGWFNPIAKDESKQIMLKAERIQDWIKRGAAPTDTVMDLCVKHGVVVGEKAEQWKAERSAANDRRRKARELKAAAAPAKKDAKKA